MITCGNRTFQNNPGTVHQLKGGAIIRRKCFSDTPFFIDQI